MLACQQPETKIVSSVLVTPRFKPIFQAQSPAHCPEWIDSLKSVKVQGNNDAKALI